MVKLVYTPPWGGGGEICAGSSPAIGRATTVILDDLLVLYIKYRYCKMFVYTANSWKWEIMVAKVTEISAHVENSVI